MEATAVPTLKLQVTQDLSLALEQCGDDAHDPLCLNPHANFIKVDKATKKVTHRLGLYLGTNCGLYWHGGVDKLNREEPRKPEDDFEWDAEDGSFLAHNVKYFIQEGYACVLTYDSDGRYQYPLRNWTEKKAEKIKDHVPIKEWKELRDYDVELEFVDKSSKRRKSSITVYTIDLERMEKKSKTEIKATA